MHRAAVIVIAWFLTSSCFAQKPNVTNAHVQEVSAATGLRAAFDAIVSKQDSPAWIGYRIPSVAREGTMCCFSGENSGHCCMGCKLESKGENSFNGTTSDCSSPEPLRYSFVFFRVESRHVMKVRNYSPDCALDFGGLPLHWMENVNPSQSVALLADLVSGSKEEGESSRSITNNAIAAIAMHDDPAADQTLEKLMQPSTPESVREHVTFWLGVERGKKGLELLEKYAKEDPSDRLREKITFAFSVSKEPGAVKDLISMARNDPSSHVRGQAIFWLAQIGGRKEAEQISDAIENDPETEVKKRAVFALSQMKDSEGVPLLIQVAKTNKNPAVRREAVRWLGFSKDPRALDFLEEILAK